MKKFIFTILFLFVLKVSPAQTSIKLDSTLIATILKIGEDKSPIYFDAYADAVKKRLYKRLDSLPYDYVFIKMKANPLEGAQFLTEHYFKKNDSLPEFVYVNGVRTNTHVEANRTLEQKIKEHTKLKIMQVADYNKVQVKGTGTIKVTNPSQELYNRRYEEVKKDIENSYFIKVAIDKTENKNTISLQTPPQDPRFKLELVTNGF